jgi:hypothetical protein
MLVDNTTCWIEAPPMKHKSNTLGQYIGFEACEELQLSIRMKILQSDCSGKFLSANFNAHLE